MHSKLQSVTFSCDKLSSEEINKNLNSSASIFDRYSQHGFRRITFIVLPRYCLPSLLHFVLKTGVVTEIIHIQSLSPFNVQIMFELVITDVFLQIRAH